MNKICLLLLLLYSPIALSSGYIVDIIVIIILPISLLLILNIVAIVSLISAIYVRSDKKKGMLNISIKSSILNFILSSLIFISWFVNASSGEKYLLYLPAIPLLVSVLVYYLSKQVEIKYKVNAHP